MNLLLIQNEAEPLWSLLNQGAQPWPCAPGMGRPHCHLWAVRTQCVGLKSPLDRDRKQQEFSSSCCAKNRGCVIEDKIAVDRPIPQDQAKGLEFTDLSAAQIQQYHRPLLLDGSESILGLIICHHEHQLAFCRAYKLILCLDIWQVVWVQGEWALDLHDLAPFASRRTNTPQESCRCTVS